MAKKKQKSEVLSEEHPVARGNTLVEVASRVNERCGVGTVVDGRQLIADPPRLPTGIFAVDFAIGGGLPIWATTCLWGPDSGGKTNLGINAMSMTARICWKCFNVISQCSCSSSPLIMKSAWLDVEGTFDRGWAQNIGVNPDDYLMVRGDYGEQFANIADDMLRADDCGLVVVDSLAALVPSDEMEADAETQFYARQARLIGRMVRKLKQRLIRERKREHPCTVLFTNQMRTKIGVMFGDPETMPGGWGMRHEFSLLLRCVKKSMTKEGKDAQYIDDKRKKRIGERFSFSIRKAKVQTLAGIGEYIRLIEDLPITGLSKGQVDDYGVLLNYAKQYGIVTKSGTAWSYFDRKASKQEDIKALWIKNPLQKVRTQNEIIARAKQQLAGGTVDVEETETPEED